LEGETDEERDKYLDFLNDDLHLLTQLAHIGDDYMVYGNVFISIYFPFDRFLTCPQCHTHYHIDTVAYKFKLKELQFSAKCGKCQYEGIFKHEDKRSLDRKKVRLIRWNPKDMRIRVHNISNEMEYYLELDARFLEKIVNGNRFYLNRTPWPIIECCAKSGSGDRPLFKFDSEAIYHMKESTLAGLPIRGWGIPPILPNFKLAYYIQVMRRYDEAIALDYIIPFRVLHPTHNMPAGSTMDPIQMLSMDNFVGHMKRMVRAKRMNSTDVQIAPFPVGYQMLGGEAKNLSPKENITAALDELLNAIGFPAELYRGSLSIQAFPVALRLFEKTWGSLVDGYNDMITWVIRRISRYFMWGDITGSLRSVTLADDIERKALSLQAAAGMDISKATAYRPLGVDYLEEQKRIVEEQKEIQRLQQEAMEEQEASQMPGAGQQPGAAPPPGGTPGATPGDIHAQAKEMAYGLLTQTPETLRRGELIKIKHSNPTLHALVMQEMDNLRQEMARQGQAMIMEQTKMASAKEIPSPLSVMLLITGQVLDYNRGDLRKIAVDIGQGVPDANKAFHFIYGKMRGWF